MKSLDKDLAKCEIRELGDRIRQAPKGKQKLLINQYHLKIREYYLTLNEKYTQNE